MGTLQGNQNGAFRPRNVTYKLSARQKYDVYLADKCGAWSRTEIARSFGISAPRVTQICKEFNDLQPVQD